PGSARREGKMEASSRLRIAIALITALAGPAAMRAQSAGGDRVPVNVMIVQTSNQKGEVDPRAQELHEKLKTQLRYRSMRVLQEERVDLQMNQVGTVELPDGRKMRVRPLHKGNWGVLMAVDVPGAVKFDARARNHHKVVIGAGEYEDGHLAVSIEPDYAD
ncbi:MAG: hypothetical protein ACREI7_07230, partial [Myxococcota bacterium]